MPHARRESGFAREGDDAGAGALGVEHRDQGLRRAELGLQDRIVEVGGPSLQRAVLVTDSGNPLAILSHGPVAVDVSTGGHKGARGEIDQKHDVVIDHFPKSRSTAHLGEPDDPPEDRVVPGFGHIEPCHRNRRGGGGLRRLVEIRHVLLERRAPEGQSEQDEGENRHGYFFSNIVENWISAGVRITIMVARKITTRAGPRES
jgi:hypothetical protein